MALFGDDDVVVNRDAKAFGYFDDLFGHLDIAARGCWIARWVIMGKNERGRVDLKGAAADFAYIDGGVVNGAGLLDFI